MGSEHSSQSPGGRFEVFVGVEGALTFEQPASLDDISTGDMLAPIFAARRRALRIAFEKSREVFRVL